MEPPEPRGRHGSQARLLILDDVFPNLLTGFRVAEFNTYLREFPAAHVMTTEHWFPTASGRVGFAASHAEYVASYPELGDRVSLLDESRVESADLAYLVFLNNAFNYLPLLQQHETPFIVTIYPGGGMQLDQPDTDDKLLAVLGSPLCRGVITTQRVTHEYLLEREFVDPALLVHIFGVVAADIGEPATDRRRFGYGKDELDVVFAAHKYTVHGRDKGYDVFIDAARRVAPLCSKVRFHVVGPWQDDGYPIDGLQDILLFHGPLAPEQLHALYRRSDIIVSPNRPFTLSQGGYDGFPLGSCVEAGLLGTAVIATNELGEDAFRDGEDLVVVRPDAQDVAERLIALLESPAEIRRLGQNAQRAFVRTYGPATQLGPRLDLLRTQLPGRRGPVG